MLVSNNDRGGITGLQIPILPPLRFMIKILLIYEYSNKNRAGIR